MNGLMVELFAQTASFREPAAQLYHRCLPLPTFSTLIGLAGAAKGISFAESLKEFKEKRVLAGVTGISYGSGRDLWNYAKIASGSVVKKDIITREFLCCLDVQIYYASDDVKWIESLQKSFKNPIYALTLGNSDELALCKSVAIYSNIQIAQTKELPNCWIHGNISDNYSFNWDKIKNSDLTIKMTAPEVVNLPVDFSFKGMVRKGSRYETFSFIPENICLKKPIESYAFGDKVVPMFGLTD